MSTTKKPKTKRAARKPVTRALPAVETMAGVLLRYNPSQAVMRRWLKEKGIAPIPGKEWEQIGEQERRCNDEYRIQTYMKEEEEAAKAKAMVAKRKAAGLPAQTKVPVLTKIKEFLREYGYQTDSMCRGSGLPSKAVLLDSSTPGGRNVCIAVAAQAVSQYVEEDVQSDSEMTPFGMFRCRNTIWVLKGTWNYATKEELLKRLKELSPTNGCWEDGEEEE